MQLLLFNDNLWQTTFYRFSVFVIAWENVWVQTFMLFLSLFCRHRCVLVSLQVLCEPCERPLFVTDIYAFMPIKPQIVGLHSYIDISKKNILDKQKTSYGGSAILSLSHLVCDSSQSFSEMLSVAPTHKHRSFKAFMFACTRASHASPWPLYCFLKPVFSWVWICMSKTSYNTVVFPKRTQKITTHSAGL